MSRRLLVSYLTITAFVLLILEIPLGITYQRSERAQLVAGLESDARTFAGLSQDVLTGAESGVTLAVLQARALQYSIESKSRVLVFDANGNRVADTSDEQDTNYRTPDRPEVLAVLDTSGPQRASIERYSSDLDQTLIFVAVPVVSGDRLLGGVRLSYPAKNLQDRVRNNWLALGLLSAVVLGAVAVVGSLLARSITQPLRSVERAAATLAAGNLQARAPEDVGPPESRRLAKEFNDMAMRLGALIGAQRSFVADASHELRTPLTALRLRIENLEFAQPEDLPNEVDVLSHEVSRLARLVEGLLALARAEGQRPEREVVDVDSEVEQRIEAWDAFAAEHEVTMSRPALTGVQVLAVRGSFSQMLDNFLANALEVSPPNSTIEVWIRTNHHTATVHVIDQGPGMGDHERARAFDRFWRAPSSAPGRGSGLGLAIVRQLAEASGGSAQLAASTGGGIDASVTLPMSDNHHTK